MLLLLFWCNRKYSLKEEYADTLVLCRYCRCLFWKSFGHPCVQCPVDVQDSDASSETASSSSSSPAPADGKSIASSNPLHIPVPPQAFLKFFSLWMLSRWHAFGQLFFSCNFLSPSSSSMSDSFTLSFKHTHLKKNKVNEYMYKYICVTNGSKEIRYLSKCILSKRRKKKNHLPYKMISLFTRVSILSECIMFICIENKNIYSINV